jgi:hypothetical protein
MGDLDAELDRLYGLPLEEFTPARNELAARLRREGDKDAAVEVKGLPKPSRVAWVLNRLARDEPELVRRLLAAGDALRRAQQEALGGGGGDELREAIAAEREAVRELAHAARRHAPDLSQAMVDRVHASLGAVAGNDEARAQLERGRATEEFERVGFPSLAAPAAAQVFAPTREPEARDDLAARRRRREEQRQRLRALRAQARELAREEARAEQEARRAEAAARKAREEAERAERRHAEAVQQAAALAEERARVEAELAGADGP